MLATAVPKPASHLRAAMQKPITDIDTIRRFAQEREEENTAFRAFYKWELDWSDEKLDRVVHEITRSVWASIDCAACGNCCLTMTPSFDDNDIARLADRVGLSPEDFEERYLAVSPERERLLAESPCPFLIGSVCSVYEDRPRDCRDFPHLLKPAFRERSLSMLSSAEDCPIVFNSLERLKKALGFQFPEESP
jgi:Fe-S-cluster containining protein